MKSRKRQASSFLQIQKCRRGSLRQLDPKVTSQRKLDIFVFNIQRIEGQSFKTHSETLEFLKELGFKTSPDIRLQGYNAVWEEINRIGEERGEIDFEIDGAVVKVNSLEQREILGSTIKARGGL